MSPYTKENIDWIFLDLDGTVWDHDTAAHAAVLAVCEKYEMSPMAFLPLFHQANDYMWGEVESGRATLEVMRIRRFEIALQNAGACGCGSVDALEVSNLYMSTYARHGAPLAGAMDLVRACAAIAHVGVITNAPRDTQDPKLKHFCTDGFEFRMIHCIGDGKGAKPQRCFFEDAYMRAKAMDPARCVMVGDVWELDIQPPREMGWHTAWISHGQEIPADRCERTVVAASPAELARLLSS